MQKFLNELKELLDTEKELTMETFLFDLEEWNSLSYVAFLAMVDEKYEKLPNVKSVLAANTVQDLFELVR